MYIAYKQHLVGVLQSTAISALVSILLFVLGPVVSYDRRDD
jgi:hypothetical protein